uniref:PiggyBac transposable element-derived protein domain-containing protein n=1 Tax=Leptobrachium leishanense TaxID=445787 RepID=A0A8C5P8P0_9ANUR
CMDVELNNPLAYLRLFLTDAVIEKIVTETNRYQDRKWEPVTKDEIWKFLALIILQGVVAKPMQKWYWTTNKLLATPFFGTVMPEYRFTLIMKYLHFVNNEEFDDTTHPSPKLHKIWDVYEMIVTNFQRTYVPERDISIDESLMAYKGQLSWVQYITSKRARFGVKSYMLCESSSAPLTCMGVRVRVRSRTKGKFGFGLKPNSGSVRLIPIHDNSTVMVHTRGGKDIMKPQVVVDYNSTMGGVDRADQAMTFYPAMRNQQKKYYKKTFRHLLEQCLWNAYILQKKGSDQSLLHSDYIWKVAKCIFLHHHTPVAGSRPGCRAVGVRDDKGKKIQKETRFHCPDCDVGLCAVPCFKIYHTKGVY